MYDFATVEEKWRRRWLKEKVYRTTTKKIEKSKKHYVLSMFPYPSGSGLHIGHMRIYNATDIYGRYKQMCGKEVLQPIGWDAFGLPAELFAIKNKIHPRIAVKKNIDAFRTQIQYLAFQFDWDRELATTDESYYRWTQWIFLQLFKKGLVYESKEPINWCPSCKTGLANEDLDGYLCERCETPIIRKPISQWVIRITDYAERLINDLDTLPQWSNFVKDLQRNWIGKGEGYSIPFAVTKGSHTIKIFTTRPDTLFGCSFIALFPEYRSLSELLPYISNRKEIEKYQNDSFAKKIKERGSNQKKTGILLEGICAIHPITKKEIPIFIADYVIAGYGTGAIFGVPAHDKRDFEFAKSHNLPIIRTIDGNQPLPYETAEGTLVHSGVFNGMTVAKAKDAIAKIVGGKKDVAYKLQDWVFSRQRYWGEPIPLIHCKKCGVVPVSEKDLPVILPDVISYEPTETGESPLASIEKWVCVDCPSCGGDGRRETNTMPQWAGSCWYYLRYIDPHNDTVFVNAKDEKQWMPVDMYIGGIEHATRHLIYARFIHKFLYDQKLVSTNEPFTRLETVGIVHAKDGKKMSKRLGNIIDPLVFAKKNGIDSARLFLAFVAPFSQPINWSDSGVAGVVRFLEKVYALSKKLIKTEPSKKLQILEQKTIKQVSGDIEKLHLNTAVSALMIFLKLLEKEPSQKIYENFIRLLAPFAPILTEEIWQENLHHTQSIHIEKWPKLNATIPKADTVTVVVQVDGKIRDRLTVQRDTSNEEILESIKKNSILRNYITPSMKMVAFIPNKLVSFSKKK